MRTENRKSPRIPKQLDGRVERVATLLAKGEDREVRVKVVDVSREGVGFIAPQPFGKDAFIRISLSLADRVGATTGAKLFTTSAVVRDCVASGDGHFHVGARLREQSGRELEQWSELVGMWAQKEF